MYRAKKCEKFCSAKLRTRFTRAKIKNKFGRQATDMRPHILSGKQRVCSHKPQNSVLACLLGRKFSFDLFCRFARFLSDFICLKEKSNNNLLLLFNYLI